MMEIENALGEVPRSTALLLNLSGDKDSTRMLGLVREKRRFPPVSPSELSGRPSLFE